MFVPIFILSVHYPLTDNWLLRCHVVLMFICYFVLQSVASIEQRTRPNLSKTLKGEMLGLLNMFPWQSHSKYWMLNEPIMNILTQVCHGLVFFSRAGTVWWTRACCSWCHHTTDHVVQTLLYLIGQTQAHSHNQLMSFVFLGQLWHECWMFEMA